MPPSFRIEWHDLRLDPPTIWFNARFYVDPRESYMAQASDHRNATHNMIRLVSWLNEAGISLDDVVINFNSVGFKKEGDAMLAYLAFR